MTYEGLHDTALTTTPAPRPTLPSLSLRKSHPRWHASSGHMLRIASLGPWYTIASAVSTVLLSLTWPVLAYPASLSSKARGRHFPWVHSSSFCAPQFFCPITAITRASPFPQCLEHAKLDSKHFSYFFYFANWEFFYPSIFRDRGTHNWNR